LAIAADQTPAPGLILIVVCIVALALYARRTKTNVVRDSNDDGVFEMLDRARQAHEQEHERRRREEPGKW